MFYRLWHFLTRESHAQHHITIKPMKGDSLPTLIRKVRLSTPPNHREQTPVNRLAKKAPMPVLVWQKKA